MEKMAEKREQYQFRLHKSYSVEEILQAGGTTAFAHKMGLTGKKQMETLAKLPIVSITDEELEEALEILRTEK